MHLPALNTVYVEAAGICNLNCRFCFSPHTNEPLGLMGEATFSAVARRIFPYAYSVNFVGYGEPLLNGLLPWMIRVAKSYRRDASVTTNGVLLSEEKICELIGAGLDSIAVSLDGATAATHDANRGAENFDRTVWNLQVLQKVKKKLQTSLPAVAIDTILTKQNRGEIEDLIQLARRFGAGKLNLAHLQRTKDDDAPLTLHQADAELSGGYRKWREAAASLGISLNLPEDFGSGGRVGCLWDPSRRLAVTWDGEVRPCCFLLHANRWRYGNSWVNAASPVLGNITRESFNRIWHSQAYRNFRGEVALGETMPSGCGPCTLGKATNSKP